MLTDYIEAAMKKADYQPSDGETWSGRIPGFHGVVSTANTKEDCEKNLRAALEEWVIFRASRNLPMPEVEEVGVAIAEYDDNTKRLEKIQQLEKEIESLKLELGGKIKPKTMVSRVKSFNEWYSTYFTLLSSIFGLIILIVALKLYGINPLQTYKDNYVKQTSSKFYNDIGDQMMNYGEFKAAEEAYLAAQKIDANSSEAIRGLARAQVFNPLAGQKEYPPEVADIKLRALRDLSKEAETDYFIPYLEGIRFQHEREFDEAIKSFEKSIRLSQYKFIGGYNSLGYTHLLAGHDIHEAVNNYEKALKLDPKYAPALNNIGCAYIILECFSDAIEKLSDSDFLAHHLETDLNLADAELYSGNARYALHLHEYALNALSDQKNLNERYVGSGATFSFMPGEKNYEEYKYYMGIYNVEQYKVFILYALSIDHALQNDLTSADKNFGDASKTLDAAFPADQKQSVTAYFANKVSYLLRSDKYKTADKKVIEWLTNRREDFYAKQSEAAGTN